MGRKKRVRSSAAQYDLSVVVPTRNEEKNILPLLVALREALTHVVSEIIFVDDSEDGTPAAITGAIAQLASRTFCVRLIHRPKTDRVGGLATAVDVGMRQARATYVAVIDADLQHPPQQLSALYDRARATDADIVMATRYRPGGSYEGLDGVSRRLISVGLKWVAKLAFPDHLMRVSDPLGGFFLLRRSLLSGVELRPIGYKISLEILVRCKWSKIEEVPYHFHARNAGESKSDIQQGLRVFQHIGRLMREVPGAARLWKFALVGASGALVNLFVLGVLLHLHWVLWLAWGTATEISILSNFVGNSFFTWSDAETTNWPQRWLRYHATNFVTIALNALIFTFLTAMTHAWLLSQVITLIGGTGLNYVMTRRFVFAPTRLPRPVAASLPRRAALVFARLTRPTRVSSGI